MQVVTVWSQGFSVWGCFKCFLMHHFFGIKTTFYTGSHGAVLINFYSTSNTTTKMAFKIPGAKPGCVPHSSCVCVQFGSCCAVPQKPCAAFLCESPMGASPQALYSVSPSCPFPPCLHVQCHPGWNELLKRELCSNTRCMGFCPGLKIAPSPCTSRDDTLQSEHLGP